MKRDTRILIVGGGIAGAVLGLALEQRGFEHVHVVEGRDEMLKGSSAITLQAMGMAVAQELGVGDDVRRRTVPLESYTISNQQGKLIKRLDFGQRKVTSASAPREFFQKLFISKCTTTQVTFRERVENFTSHNEGIDVEFASGRAGTYDLVVGADGVHSQVRNTFFPETKEIYTGGLLVGFKLPETIVLPPVTQAAEFWGDRAMCGWYGLRLEDGQDSCAVAFCMHVKNRPSGKLEDEDCLSAVRHRYRNFRNPTIQATIKNLPPSSEAYVSYMSTVPAAAQWYSERVCLVGDAAHAILPTAGMGASLAAVGALRLANSIADQESATLAFQRYRVAHIDLAKRIQNEGRILLKTMLMPQPFATLRDAAFRLIPADFLRDRISKEMAE